MNEFDHYLGLDCRYEDCYGELYHQNMFPEISVIVCDMCDWTSWTCAHCTECETLARLLKRS